MARKRKTKYKQRHIALAKMTSAHIVCIVLVAVATIVMSINAMVDEIGDRGPASIVTHPGVSTASVGENSPTVTSDAAEGGGVTPIPVAPSPTVGLSEQWLSETDEQGNVCPLITWSRDWDGEDTYELAKLVMAEAEGCDMPTKVRIVMVVLNRVWDGRFPDTIHDVIHQIGPGTVYQFSPVAPGGRYWTTEPNAECYEAVEIAMLVTRDWSHGALYFESCTNEDNWHSRNLIEVCSSGGLRFYVPPEG